ncbi:MAG: phage holin family protein [Chloroflexi bacterium]|nr:phage holin family protein [Chloroflexota bacterium]
MDRANQILVSAAALYVAVLLVPDLDFSFEADGALVRFFLVALIFGLVNAFVRPVLRIFTLPITIVTLGLFLLVINALMVMLTGAISDELGLGLVVGGFFAALLGSIVISIVGMLLSMLLGTGRVARRVV